MEYSKEVMKHFLHPKNIGEIKNADGIGKVGNPVCGDVMHLYIKVEDKKDREIIKDIKFKTLGCTAAIAVSDMLADLAKGKTVDEAKKITNKRIANALKGLPKIKYHCSLLGEEALLNAIKDYERRKNEKNKEQG